MTRTVRSRLGLSLVLIALAPLACFAQTATFNLPAQPLAESLKAVGAQTNVNVMVSPPLVDGKQAPALKANLSVKDALAKLLAGTGLEYHFVNDQTVVIRPKSAAAALSDPPPGQSAATNSSDNQKEAGKNSSQDFRVAQTDQGASAKTSSVENPNRSSDAFVLQEVVVTAEKRPERLLETPQSVTALSADDLARLGATQFRDFANTVPGLDFSTSGAGFTQITLRGVTTGLDPSPTVGIYVDDVPYGSSTAFASGAQLGLDVGLFDLDRIEVLRGPQGTLYGSSTMGGLIKYVTKQPDPTEFSGTAQAGLSGTQDGGANFNLSAAVNIPIVSDTLAIRASSFEAHDAGFIDNLALSRSDVNRSDIYGGRLDLLFKPTDALNIRITGFAQDITRDGEGTVDYAFTGVPLYGALDQFRQTPEPFNQRFRLASGTVTYDFGPALLTSISSYQSAHTEYGFDLSRLYVPEFEEFGLGSYSSIGLPTTISTDKATEELRLASQGVNRFDWLVGGFYTHESSAVHQQFDLTDLAGQPAPNDLYTYYAPSVYQEYAAFGDLTWHLTSRFDVTGGVRYARNQQSYENIGSGVLVGSEPLTHSSNDVVTYLANARYHFTDHFIGYVRYATGYRPGGPNFVVINQGTGLPYQPLQFQADTLKSYEAGIKAETVDRKLGVDLATYYIDWSNIQISTSRGGVGFLTNAPGGARIQGAELTLTAVPVSALTMTGAFAYQHAYLREADSDLGASAGERLPEVPRLTAALNADYRLWSDGVRPTLGTTVRYVSNRTASFDNNLSSLQYQLPAYTSVDARGSLELYRLNMQLYVHNLFNERGQLSALYTNVGDARVAVLQPRTIGLTLSTTF